jgi:hypothetical protein
MDNERIILGSGKMYISEFTGNIPADEILEVESNLFGLIIGGAELEYKPKFYTVTDDLGIISKSALTEEDVTLKSGRLTFCGSMFKKLSSTARISEANGRRTIKIGGIGNQDGKQYVVRFLHEDPLDGDLRVTIVGQNQSGFKLAFKKEKETATDVEFKAMPNDSEGTLVILDEEGILGDLEVTSVAGATTGKTKVTASPMLTSGDSYMYKTAATVTLPLVYDVCNVAAGFTAWDGTIDIVATTGNKILIVEVDADFKAMKAGSVTVTSKA